MNINKRCPQCGSDLKLIPSGISKNTGKPYSAFLSCASRCGYTEKIAPNAQNSPSQPRTVDKEGIILDEITELRNDMNRRFDGLAEYLKSKLS